MAQRLLDAEILRLSGRYKELKTSQVAREALLVRRHEAALLHQEQVHQEIKTIEMQELTAKLRREAAARNNELADQVRPALSRNVALRYGDLEIYREPLS